MSDEETTTDDTTTDSTTDDEETPVILMAGDFLCSMDGYTTLVNELLEVMLLLLAILKETYLITIKQILPDLATSIGYLWDGLIGLSSWVGFVVAAGYYFGAEAGYDREICDASGILDTVVGTLH